MHLLYKQKGETPLECIKRNAVSSPATYAGRLDPLAHGVLLVLEGDECQKRETYLNIPKTYNYSFILGVSTDSYDYLGYIDKIIPPSPDISMRNYVETYTGSFVHPYPPYSSRSVNGIPLFQYARKNTLNTITIPTKKIEIYTHICKKQYTKKGNDIAQEAIEDVKKVKGDFRQEEIIKKWNTFSKTHSNTSFICIDAEVVCSSGTYVRNIAVKLGEKINIPAVVCNIERTAIGNYTL